MSNQFKPDQTGFGRLCVCVCVCVCVRACLYVCWGEVVLCDRMSAACLSVGVRLCFAWRVSVSCK